MKVISSVFLNASAFDRVREAVSLKDKLRPIKSKFSRTPMHYVTCLEPVPAQQWQLSQESFHGLQRPWLPGPYGVNQN